MDLRQFYRKIREVKATLPDEFVFIASSETADGGRGGIINEVNRETAARLLVEGKAVLASPDQVAEFHRATAEAKERLEKAEIAKRIQVSIVSGPDQVSPKKPPAK